MATGSTRLFGALLACTGVVTLVITLFIVYAIRSCTKRRRLETEAIKSYAASPAKQFSVDSVDSVATCGPDSVPGDVETYAAISRSSPDLLDAVAASETAMRRPSGLCQKIQSITCFWHSHDGTDGPPGLSGRSNRSGSHAAVPELDFARLSAPMFAKRSSSLQPALGTIRSDLYRQKTTDSVDSNGSEVMCCGQLVFKLKFSVESQKLFVNVLRAANLPPKDASGAAQDVGVKCYLLPDKKRKFQTKVARKTINPEFNEEFAFTVKFVELASRMLQLVVFNFDRFSRQKIIGLVIISNLVEQFECAWETECCRDIISIEQAPEELGEILLSLCYLPTAGRLTVTIIKARNLKAMDFTGQADPYVKVELVHEGRRVKKKKKTKTARNTLNPVYNEEIVFDVPSDSIHDVAISVQIFDYDRIGSDEAMGCCWFGSQAPVAGRCHWQQMLDNVRKPVAQWHRLCESTAVEKQLRQASTDESTSMPVKQAANVTANDARSIAPAH